MLQNKAALTFKQDEWMYCCSMPSLCKLSTCMKALLLLSHGQASVERGFSVNKQVEIDNLSEDTFVAKRLICDHVTSVGALKNIDCSNKALLPWQLAQLDVHVICFGKVLKKCLNIYMTKDGEPC